MKLTELLKKRPPRGHCDQENVVVGAIESAHELDTVAETVLFVGTLLFDRPANWISDFSVTFDTGWAVAESATFVAGGEGVNETKYPQRCGVLSLCAPSSQELVTGILILDLF